MITELGQSMSMARTMSIVVAVFTALTLTHAAFVDYRADGGSATHETRKIPAQMPYLQARKFGIEMAPPVVSAESSSCW